MPPMRFNRSTIQFVWMSCYSALIVLTANVGMGGEIDRAHLKDLIIVGTGPVRFDAHESLIMKTAVGEQSIPARDVCRIGHYTIPQRGSVLRLTDGSELVGTLIDFGHEGVRWDSTAFGIADIPWIYIRSLTLQSTIDPQAWFERQEVKARALSSEDLILRSDSNWARGLSRIERSQSEDFSGFQNGLAIEWKGQEDWRPLNLSELAEIVFSEAVAPSIAVTDALEIGFRDGTRFNVTNWSIGPEKDLDLQSAIPIEFPKIAAHRSSFTKFEYAKASPRACRFLSDEDPVRYRHLPQWTVHRDLRRNAGLDGKLMYSHGKILLRGVAMPGNSQATWRLDPKKDKRFLAEVIVPISQTSDKQFGSIIAKVLISRNRSLITAWESPILRAGDAPEVANVDVSGAELIVLIVDAADFGDTSDEAYWIDPRIYSP